MYNVCIWLGLKVSVRLGEVTACGRLKNINVVFVCRCDHN